MVINLKLLYRNPRWDDAFDDLDLDELEKIVSPKLPTVRADPSSPINVPFIDDTSSTEDDMFTRNTMTNKRYLQF